MMQKPPTTLKHLHKAAVLILLALSVSVCATPSINLPINAQVPPVARANQAYSFVFSDSTFSWAGNTIDYSLTNSPGWLRLDSSSRIFSGTPASADAGSFTAGLVATDETGSSSTSVTFVVSTDPGPGLGTPLAEQLPAFGPVPSPDSLSVLPSSALSLSFSPNTFTNTNAKTVYYAICANNTPLPSWINFNPNSLTFSGTTPPSTSPWEFPQTFQIQLIASDVIGFAEAVASFQLVIESHVLNFGRVLHIINITNGLPVAFSDLQHDLTLDGQPAKSSDIRQVVASAPPWMSFNSSTLTLTGTPPADAASQNFTVTANDIYGDTTSTVVLIQNTDSLTASFKGTFGAVNATIGTDFKYDLNSKLVVNSTTKVAVDLGTASAWLNFNSNSLELQGYVPTDSKSQPIQVTVTASQGTQKQSQNLTIDIQSGRASNTQTVQDHSISAKATPGSTAVVNKTSDAKSSVTKPRKRWIAAAVIVPISLTLGFLLLVCFSLKRRRRRKTEQSLSAPPMWKISLPIQEKNTPGTEPKDDMAVVLAHNEKRASSRASKAPRLDFQLPGHSNRNSKSRLSNRAVSSTGHFTGADSGCSPFLGSTEFQSVAEVSRKAEDRTARSAGNQSCRPETPSLAAQRLSVILDESPTGRFSKQKQRMSNLTYDTVNILPWQRLSGLGHGRKSMSQSSRFSSRGVSRGNGLTSGPPGFGIVRNSWRNLSRSTWASTAGSSNLGLEREAMRGKYPSNIRPPTANTFGNDCRSHAIYEFSDDQGPLKPTLRPVDSPSLCRIRRSSGSPSRLKSNQLKVDPLQSFHKRRLRRRNSRNPLFSAGQLPDRISSRGSKTAAALQTSSSLSKSSGNKPTSERPFTPRRDENQRSYSESSSLDPPVRPSPSRSFSPAASPGRQKSYIKYQLKTRALSPANFSRPSRMNSRGSSWVSTSSDSKYGSAASEVPPFTSGFGDDLREETDENGNKRWLRGHPNPLGTHRLDVTDQELIDRLRVNGHVSAAQRLSYLMKTQTADGKLDHAGAVEGGGDAGDDNESGQVKIGSTKGKRLGLRHGDPGNLSMRGDIGNTTAGSAFI